jgi:hypothetical protein
MPTITVRAHETGAGSSETLRERVVAAHLHDEHCAAQLIERLLWATTDAEGLELASHRDSTDELSGPQSSASSNRSDTSSRRRALSTLR